MTGDIRRRDRRKVAVITLDVRTLVADLDRENTHAVLVLIGRPHHKDTVPQGEEATTTTMVILEEVMLTLGDTFLTTLTHWDHHQAVEEEVVEGVEGVGEAEE